MIKRLRHRFDTAPLPKWGQCGRHPNVAWRRTLHPRASSAAHSENITARVRMAPGSNQGRASGQGQGQRVHRRNTRASEV